MSSLPMERLRRAAFAAVLGIVVAGASALCALGGDEVRPQRVYVAAEGAAEPAASTADHDTPALRAPVLREAGIESRSDARSAVAAQSDTASVAPNTANELPAGALEVVVHAAERAAQGWVSLQRVATNDVTVPLVRPAESESPLVDGVARFDDVPRGLLLVGVHVGSDPPQRRLWVNSRVRGARIEFEIGNARIHGRIRSADGAAVEGARIVVRGRHGTVVATSAADGSYDAGAHFPAGRFTVAADGFDQARAYPQRSVDLASGAVREVSFGAHGDLVRWRARVLASDGEPVRDGDGLSAAAVQLVAHGGAGPTLVVPVVAGRIDHWFERGVFALRLAGAAPERADPRFLLPPSRARTEVLLDLSCDLVRDVQLDGAVLRGRVAPTNGGAATTTLRSLGVGPDLTATVDARGAFRFVGLPPGTYELCVGTAPSHRVAVAPHGPRVLELDLTRP
jgi:hypothetical protein